MPDVVVDSGGRKAWLVVIDEGNNIVMRELDEVEVLFDITADFAKTGDVDACG
ncbi:hypothetical protein VcTj87_21960 [Vibrio comitans]